MSQHPNHEDALDMTTSANPRRRSLRSSHTPIGAIHAMDKQPTELTISEVAERSGVPIATIKFYIREGLLPRPRTAGRTVGRYDAAFMVRLEVIRELRNRWRLSLREIADSTRRSIQPTPSHRSRSSDCKSAPGCRWPISMT